MNLKELQEEVIKRGLIKKFGHQIEFIKNLEEWQEFKATSEIPTLNNATIEIKKSDKSFYFRCKELSQSEEPPVIYQDKGYGFKTSFVLSNLIHRLIIPFGVDIMNMIFTNTEHEITGNLKTLYSEKLKLNENFYRAIVPIEYGANEDITRFFKTIGFKIDQSFTFGGLIRIENFDLFEYTIYNQTFLVVDARASLTFTDFEEKYKKIIHTYAFITGYLWRGETYYFSSKEANFEAVHEFGYQIYERPITSHSTVIPYRLLLAWDKIGEFGETRLTAKNFEAITAKVFNHPELYRCITLMTEAGDLPLELKTSIYSVCIETMRNLINDTDTSRIKPFKEKNVSKKFIESAKKLLDEIPNEYFNNKEAIVKKLNNLNQVGNTESFIEIFKIQGIELTDDDVKSLKMRNEFLHGRISFDSNDEDFELNYISDKLFQLLSYLILKYCGYTGYVLNQANLRLLLNNSELIKESYMFRRI